MTDLTEFEPLGYDDTGAGPALVFVHGLTFSRHTWDPIVALLRDRFRCIAVDLPGHGDSTGSASDPDGLAQRLHTTLAKLAVRAPVVIGHSAGALHGTSYAANFPVAGVVNVDQPLLVGGFAAMLQQCEGQLRGPEFATAFRPFEDSIGLDLLPEPERSRVATTRRIDQVTVLDHWHLPLTEPPDALQAHVDAMLGAVTAPYVYLGGEEPPGPVRAHLAAHLHAIEFVIWPNHGHLVHLAQPDRFAALITAFCARTRRTPAARPSS